MRVLMLASYFPKPSNPSMGTWALDQAQALQRQGGPILVISLSSWVPSWLAFTKGAKAFSACPERHVWGGLEVRYPRWLFYPVSLVKHLTERYPALPMRLAWWSAKAGLEAAVREFQPDVLYCHHTAVNGYVARQLQKKTGLPFVVTDHDFGEIQMCRSYTQRRQLFAEVSANAYCLVSVARRMQTEYSSQFPQANTRTVFNGARATAGEFPPRPEELAGKQVVFSSGMFYERKGFLLLLEAFAQVAATRPAAVLRIAGDGELRPAIEAKIAALGLQERVTLLGMQPQAKVLQEMHWADCFALIGWDEPFATVFSEAMSTGTPIVTASDGGINDVVVDGVHGYSVPPRDVPAAAAAIGRLLDEPSKRAEMGKAARALYESTLNWDRNAQEMLSILRAAVAARKKA